MDLPARFSGGLIAARCQHIPKVLTLRTALMPTRQSEPICNRGRSRGTRSGGVGLNWNISSSSSNATSASWSGRDRASAAEGRMMAGGGSLETGEGGTSSPKKR